MCVMSREFDDYFEIIDWSLTTWEGSRRDQLRRWRQMTLRQRLEALEGIAEVAAALNQGRRGSFKPVPPASP